MADTIGVMYLGQAGRAGPGRPTSTTTPAHHYTQGLLDAVPGGRRRPRPGAPAGGTSAASCPRPSTRPLGAGSAPAARPPRRSAPRRAAVSDFGDGHIAACTSRFAPRCTSPVPPRPRVPPSHSTFDPKDRCSSRSRWADGSGVVPVDSPRGEGDESRPRGRQRWPTRSPRTPRSGWPADR